MRKIAFFTRIVLFASFLGLALTAYAQEDQSHYLVPAWSYSPNNYVNKVLVADLNGDRAAEVIASSRDGVVYSLGSMFKGHLNWQVIMDGDVRAIVVDDIDRDGKKEILIGTDRSENNLKLVDWQGLNKGSSIDFRQKVYSLDVGDVDGGTKDIIIGSSDAGVYLFGYDVQKPAWSYKTKGPVYYVRVSDLNGDGKNEVVALSIWTDNELEKAEVSAIDPSGKLLWTYPVDGGVYSYSTSDFDVSDINGDGTAEVIVGSSKKGILVLGYDGKLLWNYDTGNLVSAIYSANLSGGNAQTILGGSAPNFYALDSAGQLLWKFPINTTVYSIQASDLNSDAKSEILVGANKYLHVLTSEGGLIITQNRGIEVVGFGKAPMVKNVDARSVSSGDIDGDGNMEAVVGYGWTESRVDSNYYLGEISVYKINKDFYAGLPEPPVTLVTSTTFASTTTSLAAATSSTMRQTEQTTPSIPLASTTTEPVTQKVNDQTPWQPIVLILLAALLISVVIIFLLYRRNKPKELGISWPQGQDI